jgi:hypothetical protein
MYAQAGITLFNDKLKEVFGDNLSNHMPERVLPVATTPPTSLGSLISKEFKEIKNLIKPGSRKRIQARAKLRSIAIIESSLKGVRSQPSKTELEKYLREAAKGMKWQNIFPGVASLKLDTEGTGLSVSIRLTKSKGEPVHVVPEGTPGATVVAVKRVNELSYYSLGLKNLAEKLSLTQPKTFALVKYTKIQDSDQYYKEIKVGKSLFKRYSPKALHKLKKSLKIVDMDEVWNTCRPGC